MVELKTWWEEKKMLVIPAFSPYPTMVSKGFLLKVVKSQDGMVWS